nr:pentalenolactone d synthase [Quercus suber]
MLAHVELCRRERLREEASFNCIAKPANGWTSHMHHVDYSPASNVASYGKFRYPCKQDLESDWALEAFKRPAGILQTGIGEGFLVLPMLYRHCSYETCPAKLAFDSVSFALSLPLKIETDQLSTTVGHAHPEGQSHRVYLVRDIGGEAMQPSSKTPICSGIPLQQRTLRQEAHSGESLWSAEMKPCCLRHVYECHEIHGFAGEPPSRLWSTQSRLPGRRSISMSLNSSITKIRRTLSLTYRQVQKRDSPFIMATTMTATTSSTSRLPADLPDQLMPQPETTTLSAAINDGPSKTKLDVEGLTKKYKEEREKRLMYKPLGTDEYRTIDGDLSHLLDDPYCTDVSSRAPLEVSCEALIIGGGYGAQLIAVHLLEAGIHNIRMIEKGSDFGGTWYWNRYPGAQCDIESYVYMPLLHETQYVPTQKYAGGIELLEHARRIGTKYGLYDKAIFQTEVKTLRWNEATAHWDVSTNRNDMISARFVIPAAGPLHRPKLPGLTGLGTFEGKTFHTSRWDYAYTGGDASGNLAKLAGKRVGVIGTGATAVQIVPHLGAAAEHLYVFQRTPSSIDVRGNKPTDPAWVATLGEGWQTKRMDNFNIIVNGGKQDEDLVADGWTDILRNLASVRGRPENSDPAQLMQARQLLDFEKMDQIRRRVDSIVHDPATAESLKPYYNQFCKRPCFHDEYLQTFNRPNVTLVDTRGKGVDAITPRGVVANGREVPLDCLIYATGFELATSWSQRTGIEVYGRGGRPLTDKWRDGLRTLHGHSTHGFPNCFFVSNQQAALSPNFLHITAEQGRHLAYVLAACAARGARTVEATRDAEDAWTETILEAGRRRSAFRAECTPGYYNSEGKSTLRTARNASYAGGALEFTRIVREWREQDRLEGMEVTGWDGEVVRSDRGCDDRQVGT